VKGANRSDVISNRITQGLTLQNTRTEQTAAEGCRFVGRTSEGTSIQAVLDLDKEAPKEQDAQYQQNCDYDDLNQSHSRFLDTQRSVGENRRRNTVILKAQSSRCQQRDRLISERLYGFGMGQVQWILGILSVFIGPGNDSFLWRRAVSRTYCRPGTRCRRVRGVVFNLGTIRIDRLPSLKRCCAPAFHFMALVCLLLLSSDGGHAQALTARISVVSLAAPARLRVEGSFVGGLAAWSFRNSYGRITGLGDRIQNLSLADANGASIAVRKVIPGEFKADRLATRFRYEVILDQPANPADAAHVSGLTDQYGYLMLADLLPQLPSSNIRVTIQLPPAWHVASSFLPSPDGSYYLPDSARGVFFLGRDLKEKHKRVGATEFVFVTAGEWPFAGDAVTKIGAKIIEDHRRHAGFEPKGRVMLMLAPFPGSSGSERWSAETRGSNLVLLLGRNSRPKALLGQLSVVLSHELFHVWVPNGLSLDGDFDWFFEGFTLYQALRCAVRLGFIDFQEYLDTLGRVYDSYLASEERDRLSLVEASQRRWTSGSSLVYDKGMLVAFLYDLKLRNGSGNRRSLDDVYHELFRRFPSDAERVDGNESIVLVLMRHDGDEQIVRSYIQTPGFIDLETILPVYGIRITSSGHQKRLLVAETLNPSQRTLLESLGYRKR